MFLKMFLLGVVLPAVVSGVALIAAWQPWRRGAKTTGGLWSGALALGAGYVAGHVGIAGLPPFPPTEATHWLVYLALAAMALGLIDALWQRGPAWVRWGLRLILAGATVWLLLRSMFEYTWGPVKGIVWLAVLGIALLALWTELEALAERQPGATLPLILLVVTAASSGMLLVSGSALLSQLGGALTATLGASLLVAWWSPSLSLARGAVPVAAVLLAGLWFNGYFYAEAPAVSVLLLALALTAAWVGQVERVRRLAPWQASLVRIVAVIVPVALAVTLALRTSPHSGYG